MTLQQYNDIISYLRGLIAGTRWEGHVFVVGGSCRDKVMGRKIHDIDLAVNLPDGGVCWAQELWEKGLTVSRPTVFERYGTAMLQLSRFPGLELEMVQTRRGRYDENTDRDGVASVFGTLEDDAFRRDFTINALFYDISNDKLLDLTGRAVKDIEAKVIDTPMSPEETFKDDPVRMLRCIRIATALDWHIPDHIVDTIKKHSGALSEIKIERMRAEVEKMITGPHSVRALRLLRSCKLIEHVAPGLSRTLPLKSHKTEAYTWDMALRAFSYAGIVREPAIAWAILLYGAYSRGKARSAKSFSGQNHSKRRIFSPEERILRGIHYHSPLIKQVEFMLQTSDVAVNWGPQVQNVKDRRVKSFVKQCSSLHRLEMLMRFIDILNNTLPERAKLVHQMKALRLRMDQLKAIPQLTPNSIVEYD